MIGEELDHLLKTDQIDRDLSHLSEVVQSCGGVCVALFPSYASFFFFRGGGDVMPPHYSAQHHTLCGAQTKPVRSRKRLKYPHEIVFFVLVLFFLFRYVVHFVPHLPAYSRASLLLLHLTENKM